MFRQNAISCVWWSLGNEKPLGKLKKQQLHSTQCSGV
jgi:hypothetical protein